MTEGDEQKRSDWEENHRKIANAYLELIGQKLRRPTNQELSAWTGLDVSTVKRHLKELRFEPLNHPARVLTDSLIHKLAQIALDGDTRAISLWFLVMEGITPQSLKNAANKKKPFTGVSIEVIRQGAYHAEDNSGI